MQTKITSNTDTFRVTGVTIDDLRHHLAPLLKTKPEHIILNIGTNDDFSKKSGQILDELLQVKQYITSILPACKVIVSRPAIGTDNGKVPFTAQKTKFSIKDFFSKCDQIWSNLVTFTQEILNGKLHFSVQCLTLSNFSKDLGQLEIDFIDNVNIKEVHLGENGLHLNKKGKNRLELNFLQKLRNL